VASKGLTDIPGIRVGHASDFDGLTGCTVILCDKPATGGVDIRGSATGTEEMDTLSPGHVAGRVDAVVLAGGSAFGLEAASGVRRFLEQKGVGFPTGATVVPIVPSAILYDLGIGKSSARPTREMGEVAASAATDGPVAEGAIGAGTGATVGKVLGMRQAMKSGIGSAVVSLEGSFGGVHVAALAAVNAVGDIRDPSTGKIIAGARRAPDSAEFADSQSVILRGGRQPLNRENTTLVVVATNARLDRVQTTKLAQLAGLGMARTIYPVNTMSDGDVVIALSLGDQRAGDQRANVDALGIAAAEAVAQAILRSVRMAKTMGGVPGLAGK
jgi:L-aminopeptidase/D-esterase-like protein